MDTSTERLTPVSQGRKMNDFEFERSKNVINSRTHKNRDMEKTRSTEYLRGVEGVRGGYTK